jgi:hypothetical protein
MNTKIYEALNITREGYTKLIIEKWMQWCYRHAVNNAHWQFLITDKRLFAWYKNQIKALNHEFAPIAVEYKDIPAADRYAFYLDELEAVTRYYPRPLLNRINKPKQNEPIYN